MAEDNRRHNALYLHVPVVLLLHAYSCITTCSRSPLLHIPACACVLEVHAFEWVSVCVSHDGRAASSFSCSLSDLSVRLCTNLIHSVHFYLPSFRVNMPNFTFQFCITWTLFFVCQCFVSQHKLHSSLRLLFWLEASTPTPRGPSQIACRHTVFGSTAGFGRHVGQFVWRCCSLSWILLLFQRPWTQCMTDWISFPSKFGILGDRPFRRQSSVVWEMHVIPIQSLSDEYLGKQWKRCVRLFNPFSNQCICSNQSESRT